MRVRSRVVGALACATEDLHAGGPQIPNEAACAAMAGLRQRLFSCRIDRTWLRYSRHEQVLCHRAMASSGNLQGVYGLGVVLRAMNRHN